MVLLIEWLKNKNKKELLKELIRLLLTEDMCLLISLSNSRLFIKQGRQVKLLTVTIKDQMKVNRLL